MNEFGWDYDVDSVCRICLQDSKDLTSIYECNDASDNSLLLFEKIEKIGGIKIISDSALPSHICRKCNAFLNVAHKFRIICRRSDNYLREFVYKAITQATSDEDDEEEEQQLVHLESGTEAAVEEYLVGYEEDDVNNEAAAAGGDVYEIDAIQNIVEQEEVIEEEHQDINSTTEDQYTEMWLNENAAVNDEVLANKRDSSNESVKECSETVQSTNIVKAMTPKALDISSEETGIDTSIDNTTATEESAVPKSKTKPTTNQKYAHVCNICGNSNPRKYSLESHMRRHRGIRPYECEICHAAFHLNFELTRHIRKHTGDRPYKCQYCERCFADRSTLVKHERIHTNERPYACETCGKTFTYSSVLKVHIMTHTGEKPFNCGICNKRFARGHHLRAHLETQLHQNDPQAAKLLRELKRDCND